MKLVSEPFGEAMKFRLFSVTHQHVEVYNIVDDGEKTAAEVYEELKNKFLDSCRKRGYLPGLVQEVHSFAEEVDLETG